MIVVCVFGTSIWADTSVALAVVKKKKTEMEITKKSIPMGKRKNEKHCDVVLKILVHQYGGFSCVAVPYQRKDLIDIHHSDMSPVANVSRNRGIYYFKI